MLGTVLRRDFEGREALHDRMRVGARALACCSSGEQIGQPDLNHPRVWEAHEPQWAAIGSIAQKFGITAETLRGSVHGRNRCGKRPDRRTAKGEPHQATRAREWAIVDLAKVELARTIDWYNYARLHSACGGVSPA